MFNRIKVKCVTQDEYKTLTIDKEYDILHTYDNSQFLIINDKGWEQFYDKKLFEDVLI